MEVEAGDLINGAADILDDQRPEVNEESTSSEAVELMEEGESNEGEESEEEEGSDDEEEEDSCKEEGENDEESDRDRLDVYRELSSYLKDEGFAEEFGRLMFKGKLEILDFAIICQEEESTIRDIYDSDPEQLKLETLIFACKYGAQPGVIPFLAEARPELVSCEWNHGVTDQYPISFAMSEGPGETRPAEEDIQALAEAWPEGVAKTMKWLRPIDEDEDDEDIYVEYLDEEEAEARVYEKCNPLRQCLSKEYSNELLEFMLNCLPAEINRFEVRDGVQAQDKEWISRVLPKIQDFLWVSGDDSWDGQASHELLKELSQNTSITRLGIVYPGSFCSSDGTKEELIPEGTLSLINLLTNQPSLWTHPKIEFLSIVLLSLPESYSAYCKLLHCLPHWPCLRRLVLFLCDYQLQSATPILCRLLGQGSLQYLNISVQTPSGASRKRKSSSQMPLQPIFDALTTNSSLTELVIDEMKPEDSSVYNLLLLKALKENVTLKEVGGECEKEYSLQKRPWVDLDVPGAPRRGNKELTYYLTLNQCGRAVARDTTTHLEDFVKLLGTVEQNLGDRHSEYIDNVQHGLLREAVSIWAVPPFS